MLCEKCGKNQVTHSYRQIINGVEKHFHLCDACATQYDLPHFMKGLNDDFANFFNSFFGMPDMPDAPKSEEAAKRCEGCGASFEEIINTGKAGCARCYAAFDSLLAPTIERIHGKSRHVGRVPVSADHTVKSRHQLETLKMQLEKAVSAQEFEKAATLRDEIRILEGQNDPAQGEGGDQA